MERKHQSEREKKLWHFSDLCFRRKPFDSSKLSIEQYKVDGSSKKTKAFTIKLASRRNRRNRRMLPTKRKESNKI